MRHTLSRERCTTPPTHDDNSLDAGGRPDGPDKRHRRRSHNTPLARSWTCQIAGGSHGRHFYVWCAGAPTLILAPAGPACGLPATQRSCGGTWPIALTRWRWALPAGPPVARSASSGGRARMGVRFVCKVPGTLSACVRAWPPPRHSSSRAGLSNSTRRRFERAARSRDRGCLGMEPASRCDQRRGGPVRSWTGLDRHTPGAHTSPGWWADHCL